LAESADDAWRGVDSHDPAVGAAGSGTALRSPWCAGAFAAGSRDPWIPRAIGLSAGIELGLMSVDDSCECAGQDRLVGGRQMSVEVAVDGGQVQRRGLPEGGTSGRREGG